MKIPSKPPVFSELLIKIFESDRKKGTDLLLQKSKAVDKKGRYVVSLIMLWVLGFKIPFTSSYSI